MPNLVTLVGAVKFVARVQRIHAALRRAIVQKAITAISVL